MRWSVLCGAIFSRGFMRASFRRIRVVRRNRRCFFREPPVAPVRSVGRPAAGPFATIRMSPYVGRRPPWLELSVCFLPSLCSPCGLSRKFCAACNDAFCPEAIVPLECETMEPAFCPSAAPAARRHAGHFPAGAGLAPPEGLRGPNAVAAGAPVGQSACPRCQGARTKCPSCR